NGSIILPSSLDKAETAIIGASLEIIQRIGPCNAKIKVTKIEDIRISKRQFVITRAKQLLRQLTDSVLPDSQELADEVSHSVRMMEVSDYGKDRLPAGPSIDDSEEIIVVEGRADVLILLKHGFKNVIAMNGTSVPQTIIQLSRRKTMTAFVDGDRGGDLNIQELLQVAELDFVTKAPDGKEVEELTQKEIHKCLRSKIAAEQAKLEFSQKRPMPKPSMTRSQRPAPRAAQRPAPRTAQRPMQRPVPGRPLPRVPVRAPARPPVLKVVLSAEEKTKFKGFLEELMGTRGACILDKSLKILGKVPITELTSTLKSLSSGVYAIVMDGSAEKDVAEAAERSRVKHIVCKETKISGGRVNILTADKL
ncbi:DNA primase DnaG, partial [Nanoarchaeota archaeon]